METYMQKPPPWELRGRGLKDSLRHDKKVKEAIRKNLRRIISEEAIITSDGTKRVKIPIRYLEQYRFKYGQPQQGVGQGQGQPGNVIGRTGQQGTDPGDGQAGDQPGELEYEVEVPLEELTRMMLEDLALPWLEQKPEREIKSESYEHTDIRRRGSLANLAKKRTLFENLKRNSARGFPEVWHIMNEDLRFKVWDVIPEVHANAAVYMLMDRSGSMTTGKKYIARSFFFWMVRFLRLKYEHVDTIFIAHDTEAHIVPEKDFFALSNDGGTRCSSAYEVAMQTMAHRNPPSRWNVYVFHFSDGDNLPYDNAVCKTLVKELITQCSMVGYGEIRYKDDASFYGWTGAMNLSSLQSTLKELKDQKVDRHEHLLIESLANKESLYQVLQRFLSPQPLAAI